MHGFNSPKCSVTPDFLLTDRFRYRISTFYEKLRKSVLWKFDFFNFSAQASSNSAIILAARCREKPISKVAFN